MEHDLYIGNSVNILPAIPSNSVQLMVTSPPYGDIKDYGSTGQIGFGQTYDQYLNSMNYIWEECYRILEPGCKAAINVGEQFKIASKDSPYQILPIPADVIRHWTKGMGTIYLGGIIWEKITNTKTSGGGTFMGSLYHPRDGYITYEHEFILLFKKPGKARKPTKEQKEKSLLTKEQRSSWFRGIWNIPPVKQKDHSAMFPVELPERLIRMYTFYNETVLDPFMGSGTTAQAAEESGRNSIGIELQKNNIPICLKRVPDIKIHES